MLRRTIIILLCAVLTAFLSGCPSRQANEAPEEVYHVGTWTGTIEVEARMVLVGPPPPDQPAARYWNAVWRVEANVHLNEYQDGSMDGTATGDLFHWFVYSDQILDYNQIKELVCQLAFEKKLALIKDLVQEKSYRESFYQYTESLVKKYDIPDMNETDLDNFLHS